MGHSTIPKDWELAGLVDDRGELGSPGAPGSFWVPDPPSLESEGLVWRSHEGVIGVRPLPPSPGLLADFTRLAGGDAAQYAKFASRWGMLGLEGYPLPPAPDLIPEGSTGSRSRIACITNSWTN